MILYRVDLIFFYQMLKANGRAKKYISVQLIDDVSDFDKIDS